VPYRLAFTRIFLLSDLGDRSLEHAFTLDERGALNINLDSSQEILPVVTDHSRLPSPPSTLVISGDTPDQVITRDGRFSVRILTRPFGNKQEYWLQHTDEWASRSYRVRLSAEVRADDRQRPRIALAPGADLFIADDDGTVRLYGMRHFMTLGAFQVAHSSTDNQIVALAISSAGTLLAGLSRWKDIVLYNVPERKLDFVRQIHDQVGWYDRGPGLIMLAGDGEAIVTVGVGQDIEAAHDAPPVLSVNGFQFIPLPEHE
jgi:hypothetical protein